MDNYYFILDGKTPYSVGFEQWAAWFASSDRAVAKTEFEAGVIVSTVFLGMNHALWSATPILFETMVFGGEHDSYRERYATWEEAEAGHQRAVELILGNWSEHKYITNGSS